MVRQSEILLIAFSCRLFQDLYLTVCSWLAEERIGERRTGIDSPSIFFFLRVFIFLIHLLLF